MSSDSLIIAAVVAQGNSAVGAAEVRTAAVVSSYTQVSVPFAYVSAATPDTVEIVITIIPPAGSMFKMDDLAFSGATGVERVASQTPLSFSLHQNCPNPFNP